MKKRWIVIGILLLLAMVILGFLCYRSSLLFYLLMLLHPGKQNADAAIRTGSYWRIEHRYARPTPVAVTVIKLDIDREKDQAIFYLQDGSRVQAALAGSAEAQWSEGCPTMAGTTKMEILPLAEDRLVLGDTTFENPYLVGTCPAPPFTIVLAEGKAGQAGVSYASQCDWYDGGICIYFGQEYVTLHVQVCDRESDEPLPDASLTLEFPWGKQAFPGYFQVRLEGDAQYPITVSAPGYGTYQGTIEVQSESVTIWTATAVGEPTQASVLEEIVDSQEVDINICLDK